MFKTARLTYDVSVNLSLHVNCSLRGIGNKSGKHTDRQTDMLIAILRIHLRSEVLKISRPLFIGRIACAQCIKYGLLLQMSLSHVAWSVCLSVCLSVCWSHRCSIQKMPNRSRCRLVADSGVGGARNHVIEGGRVEISHENAQFLRVVWRVEKHWESFLQCTQQKGSFSPQ